MADNAIVEINGKYYETASMHRRLFAAAIDIMIIFFVLSPITHYLSYLIWGGMDLQMILTKYASVRGNVSHQTTMGSFMDYLFFAYQEGLLQKWLLLQVVIFVMLGIVIVGFWIYKGATIGKMITRCELLDLNSGKKPKPIKCIMRYICYLLSAFPAGIGFFMIQFTKYNQGLHDILTNTVVIKKSKV